jgi:hypothetical protein
MDQPKTTTKQSQRVRWLNSSSEGNLRASSAAGSLGSEGTLEMDGIIGTGGFKNDHRVVRRRGGRILRRNERDWVRINEKKYAPFLHKPFSEPVYLAATRPNKRKQ